MRISMILASLSSAALHSAPDIAQAAASDPRAGAVVADWAAANRSTEGQVDDYYARQQAEYEARLAEHQRQMAQREKANAEAAARHAANKAAAEAALVQHQRDLARHRQTVENLKRDAARNHAE